MREIAGDAPGGQASSVRVLTFYDEKGWAWWHRAHHIGKNLSPAIDLTILQNGARFDPRQFDLILLFEHYLLNLVPDAPRDKIILGSSCPKLAYEMAERLQSERCLAGLVNNRDIHSRISDRGRIFCCQNGVDAELFFPAGRLPEKPQACWVGNSKSIGNKGLDLIREACKRAGVPLLVLDKADLAAGPAWTQEQVRDGIYHRSTFYICASEFEGTPNPMLEALACGLPVISTRVGNAPEILRDGYNGMLVERSVESIAQAIGKLMRCDPAVLASQARSSIEAGWTWKQRTAPYEAMFLELAGRGRSASLPAMAAAAPPKPPEKKSGFTGMVAVPFLAPKDQERALYMRDLQAKARELKDNPKDFDNLLAAALDCIRLGDYPLAKEFTAAAASMTRYYHEVIRDLSLHILERERKRKSPTPGDAAKALGNGKIRVAMLTYNALEYTKQCLHTLLTRTRRPLEIHIRENASKDDTAKWLRQLNHPQVHVEYGEDNRGVPGGRNRLIEMIRPVAGPEDFVVFLDNDIEMLEGWEDHYLEFFADHPHVGIASNVGQKMVVEGDGRRLFDPKEGPAPVDVALGGYACWVRAPDLMAIGGYDENLGLFWHEDDDLCVRAIGKGIDVWAVPGAPLIHHGHKSGVALTGLSAGGSPKNLAYLADKWRKLGLVLPNGEIDRSAVMRKSAGGRGSAPGFNVFGPFSSRAKGAAARRSARTLIRMGYSVSLHDTGGGGPGIEGIRDLAPYISRSGAAVSHPINLFHLPPGEIRSLWDEYPALKRPDVLQVCAPDWPLARMPDAWTPILESMHVVAASSRVFQGDALARLRNVPVRYLPPAAETMAPARTDRADWKIPPGAIVFGHAFDLAEDIERQNPTDVIQAFTKAFGDRKDVVLCVRASGMEAKPEYRLFMEKVRALTREIGNILYSTEPLSGAEEAGLMTCWDAGVFLHRAAGAGSSILECMALGKPVIATGCSACLDYLDGENSILVRHDLEAVDPECGYGPGPGGNRFIGPNPILDSAVSALIRMAGDASLRKTLGGRAREDMGRRSDPAAEEVFFQGLAAAYRGLPAGQAPREDWVPGPRGRAGGGLRVLLQNRPGAESSPGGDTMVMDRYREGLEAMGVSVAVNHHPTADYRKFDIVHLFNLVLPQVIEPLARAAHDAGVPYVVQALQEDQAGYRGQSQAMARSLAAYVQQGQAKGSLTGLLEKAKRFEVAATDSSGFTAVNARVLLCNSREEELYVRKLHPGAFCQVIHYGVDHPAGSAGPDEFEKAFGVKDFLLCVGRLETRKNQLALLAALEDEDVTLVLADGGVCYHPEYADICRKFRRRGRTLFTGRMSPQMLASCYRAARAHVLPSWQELPGLVTLEAAMQGCNVAATPHGGIREYMGDSCIYFEPDDLPGMRQAALAAFHRPRMGAAVARAEKFTWQATVGEVMDTYRGILAAAPQRDGIFTGDFPPHF